MTRRLTEILGWAALAALAVSCASSDTRSEASARRQGEEAASEWSKTDGPYDHRERTEVMTEAALAAEERVAFMLHTLSPDIAECLGRLSRQLAEGEQVLVRVELRIGTGGRISEVTVPRDLPRDRRQAMDCIADALTSRFIRPLSPELLSSSDNGNLVLQFSFPFGPRGGPDYAEIDVTGWASPMKIRKTVFDGEGEFRRCQRKHAEREPVWKGRAQEVWVKFSVDAEGKVTEASAEESRGAHPATAKCFVGHVRATAFPKPWDGKPYQVRMPIRVSAETSPP